MKHVKKSVLLSYSPHEMYALVIDVKAYPEFLPWCARADVLERRDDGITARLHLSYFGVRQAFTTRNTHTPDQSVVLELVDGPFSMLAGTWRFVPLPAAAGPRARTVAVAANPSIGPRSGNRQRTSPDTNPVSRGRTSKTSIAFESVQLS